MRSRERVLSDGQAGGIVIVVALMLLALVTVAAVAMSRNSLREIIISGTTRQGTEVRNVADSGLEWACYWLTPDGPVTKAAPDTAAAAFLGEVKTLSGSMELSGDSKPISATGVMTYSQPSDGATRAFNLDLIRMGKQYLELSGGAPSTGAGGVTEAIPREMWPDIWSVRSTGTLDVAGVTFQHIREAWVTAPPQVQ